MKSVDYLKKLGLYSLMTTSACYFTACDDDAPEAENEVEVFTDVTLIFTNEEDANDVVTARAKDPDGVGLEELEILDDITLQAETTYTLTYEILNALIPDDPENIGAEILEEDHEHQFFFGFTVGAFTDPTGNGNVDGNTTGDEAINYNDTDDNGNPVGLSTSWTTSATTMANGLFKVQLQHQPDVKTSTSGVTDGDTDFELEFTLNIE